MQKSNKAQLFTKTTEPTLFQKRNKVQAPRASLSRAHNKKAAQANIKNPRN